MNLSKLVDEDEPLFLSLIDDMFPGIKLTTQSYKDLQKAIANATVSLGIINHAEWNLKTVQVSFICTYASNTIRSSISFIEIWTSRSPKRFVTGIKSLHRSFLNGHCDI